MYLEPNQHQINERAKNQCLSYVSEHPALAISEAISESNLTFPTFQDDAELGRAIRKAVIDYWMPVFEKDAEKWAKNPVVQALCFQAAQSFEDIEEDFIDLLPAKGESNADLPVSDISECAAAKSPGPDTPAHSGNSSINHEREDQGDDE